VRSASAKAPADNLREKTERRLVSQNFTNWNLVRNFLRRVDYLRHAA
jgi:hypothetical protein